MSTAGFDSDSGQAVLAEDAAVFVVDDVDSDFVLVDSFDDEDPFDYDDDTVDEDDESLDDSIGEASLDDDDEPLSVR